MKKIIEEYNNRQYMQCSEYEFFYYEDKSPLNIEYHNHDFYEIYFLFSGKLTYIIDSRSYNMQSGDILLINPKQIHKPILKDNTGTYERMVLWIKHDFLKKISTNKTNLLLCFENAFLEKRNLIRTSSYNSLIKPLLLKLHKNLKQDEFGSDILKKTYLNELLVLINRLHNKDNNKKTISDIEINLIAERVTDFIEKNIEKQITLNLLSQELFISKFHLSREFKRYTGCTVHKYIMKKRLIYAKELIRKKIPITQVYLKCGFNDYSSFLRAFKTEYNITPKQLIKK